MIKEYLSIIRDPGHVLAELTFLVAEALILTPVIKRLIKFHDKKHHGLDEK
jgi:hypothetical protein